MLISGDDFLIRELAFSDEDLSSVLEVYRQCEDFLALGPAAVASIAMVQADWQHSKDDGAKFCGIYTQTGRLVGVIDFVPTGYEGCPQAAFLSLLMIGAPFRSQGLGARVVHAVEEQICREHRITAIHSGVQVNNPSAIRFWQRLGYQIVSEPTHMADGTTTFALRKEVPHGLELI